MNLQEFALSRLAHELAPIATQSDLSIAEFCVALKRLAACDALLRTALNNSIGSTRMPTECVPVIEIPRNGQ